MSLPQNSPFVQLGATILLSWEQKVSQICKELLHSSPSSNTKGSNYNEKHHHHCMTEDRSRLLKLCFEEMEEVARLHDDLECCLNEVKRELNYILSELNVRDYHHDETLRYLGHEPDSKLNEGEIELTNHNITWIRNCCYDAISETEKTLLPYFKTKK